MKEELVGIQTSLLAILVAAFPAFAFRLVYRVGMSLLLTLWR